ncbi:MAG TPA: DUF2220 domain-containing protein [Candidatus Mediterraneibacter tabaqchaliae]|uniref:DUF2220 domain-containing protein n=1 Tax=Candidatus Mediterraneibacter tabaqchaliae TaxID=2838689 RepID=A0A9D2U298_9FIRM|nr:DUF2220 domain-containing protein [Candidatus Mediterraneibacter tabaqchaliae]
MNSKDYVREILDQLMKKYQNRAPRREGMKSQRRVMLKPAALYRHYADNNADISVKQEIHEAVDKLLDLGMVTADYLKFSTDIEKICLCEDKAEEIYRYLEEEYGDIPQGRLRQQAESLLEKYGQGGDSSGISGCTGENSERSDETSGAEAGSLVAPYICNVRLMLEKPGYCPDPERIGANLKMLRFMEENREKLYVKEASMLVYGDSKWFEEHNYDEICSIARQALGMPQEEDERNDAVLARFGIYPTEQEIFIKGDWILEWKDHVIRTAGMKGGIAVLSGDIQDLVKIRVRSPSLMTVENKTSYQRMQPEGTALVYLGGFAVRYQVRFLEKVLQDNPELECLHFGDIDVGGFLIHRHLCRAVGARFNLYRMGIRELEDPRFQPCRKKLTENDRIRMKGLMEEEEYREVLAYMDEHDVKLEQETISYYEERERQRQLKNR